MTKHTPSALRVVALAMLAALLLVLAACNQLPGLPPGGAAPTAAAKAGEAGKAAATAVSVAQPTAAAKAAEAGKAAATAVTSAQATTAPAGATAAPKAAATSAAPATAAPAGGAAQPTAAPGAAGAAAQPTAAPGAAQTAPAGKTSQTLEGPVWKLQSYTNAQGQTAQAVANANVTAEFKGGRVTGSAGCNTYFASYKVDGNKLTISQAGSTMMACPDPAVMAQEALFLQSLSKAATYQISGDTLTIADASGKASATFQATAAPSLTSNPWDVISFNNGKQAVVSVNPAAPMTAVFTADGKVSGSAGCNSYTGGYQVDGNKIKIGPLATTQKACPQPIMEQETQFLKALQSSATWSIFNGVLGMRTAQDAMSVNFLPGATSAGLAGSNWKATGINNGKGAVESLPTGVEVTAQFGTDGRVSGSSGCNTYSGPFQVDGDSIKIGPVISTMKACEGPAMQTENLYLKALGNSTKWAMEGANLVLRDAAGAMQVTFAPVK